MAVGNALVQRTTLCGLVGTSGGLVVVVTGGREMAMGMSVVGLSGWKSVQFSSSSSSSSSNIVGSISSSRRGGGGERRWRAVREEVQVAQNEETQNGASILPPAYPTFGGSSPSNEYIGFGMLEEKEAFYRERFVVRFSEVGDRGTTSLEMLASLLQEAACNHVLKIGYGAFPGMNERLITVTTRMHIEVDRYPAWRDLLEIDTWFCTEGRNAVRRDWTVKDVNSGEMIAFATSTWVLMHMDTKTIHRITDNIRAEFAPWVRDPPTWALSEERRNTSSGRISKIDGDADIHKCGLYPLDRDFDMNQHVNNVKYISWTLESLSQEFRENHEVSKITLEYRREVCKGDTVDSMAKVEPSNSSKDGAEKPSREKFVHLIKNQHGQEINKGRTVWRQLTHPRN